jgi:APA family basic amino acid/polyamine antiporter
VFVLLGTFDTIVAYFVFITVVFIALTVASVFVIRQDAAFRVPGHPWTAIVFLVMVGALLVLLALNNPVQAALGAAVVATGLPVYGVVTRGRPAVRLKETPV